MPLSFKAHRDQTKTVTIEYEGETIGIRYKPKAYNTRLTIELEDLDTSKPMRPLINIMLRLISSWDVVDEDGTQMIPTEELMLDLEPAFLVAVFQAISSDMVPNPTRSELSSSGLQ